MLQAAEAPPPRGLAQVVATGVGRVLVSIFVPVVAFVVLWAGFLFLKDSGAPKLVIVVVAIVWGIGGVAMLYVVANWLTEKLPPVWYSRILPFVFIGPAIAILAFYLLVPAFLTGWGSLFNATGEEFVGLDNYVYSFSNPDMVTAIRNNVLWLVFGTLFSTGMGLAIAVLVDRSRLDRVAKTLIFLPMAISFVGASVIWRFVYSFQPEGQPQIGLLNAILGSFGVAPVSWLTSEPLNTILLIVILIWGQTGFAMVIISAALKGVPDEMLRGRAHRRRERVAGLPAAHRPHDLADDRDRRDDDRHSDPEDLRHRHRDDERQLQHPGHRHAHVEAGLHILRPGPGSRAGGDPAARRHAGHLVQPPAVPRPGDLRPMR